MANNMANENIVNRIIQAAGQGAVGALVGAILSAVTEPVVNRVLVKRIPLQQAIDELKIKDLLKYFETTLPTNFIKFPFFEVVNIIMMFVDVSPSLRGTVTGAVFTSTTLPITNYRYKKSMGQSIDAKDLYQAFLPTVLRDIVYGVVRQNMNIAMMQAYPELTKTNGGRFISMFCTVFASCVISAPGNEFRGYCLQPPDRKLAFGEFFKPEKFLRSTFIGATIMSTALACGAVMTPKVQQLFDSLKSYFSANPLAYILVALFMGHQYLENKRRKADKEGKKA